MAIGIPTFDRTFLLNDRRFHFHDSGLGHDFNFRKISEKNVQLCCGYAKMDFESTGLCIITHYR